MKNLLEEFKRNFQGDRRVERIFSECPHKQEFTRIYLANEIHPILTQKLVHDISIRQTPFRSHKFGHFMLTSLSSRFIIRHRVISTIIPKDKEK